MAQGFEVSHEVKTSMRQLQDALRKHPLGDYFGDKCSPWIN